MTEQEQELIDRYLKYIRKRRIIISIVILSVFIFNGLFFLSIYVQNKNQSSESYINNEIEENVLNEVTNTTVNNNIQTDSKTTKENNNEEQKDKTAEPQKVIENTEKVVETSQPKPSTPSTKKEQNTKKPKPANKDFLFVDGYTMENVSQVAQEYLKSSGYAGECIPLKDDEGIYIGMRVIFY